MTHVILELYKHVNMIISILGQLKKFKYQTSGRFTHEKQNTCSYNIGPVYVTFFILMFVSLIIN